MRPSHRRDIGRAAALAAVVVATEYFFRHVMLFWMPQLGSLRTNDMTALALAYGLLLAVVGRLTRVNWRSERTCVREALIAAVTQWQLTRWVVALFLSVVVSSVVDQVLWAGVRLPMWVSAWRNPLVWFLPAAAFLSALAQLMVNGVLVPFAEEFLWRGQVQVRLLNVMAPAAAIGITAVLFSLKHVIVDASFARFLTLTAFGAICGVVARRDGWSMSAALHIIVNTISTAVGLARGLL